MQQTLSLGGRSDGARFQGHQVAWLALVAGRKFWAVAPPSEPSPENPSCDYDADRKRPFRQCVMRPGPV